MTDDKNDGWLKVVEPTELWEGSATIVDRLRSDHWALGISAASIEQYLRVGESVRVHWMPNPRGEFRADPFHFADNGMVFERFALARGRGRLAYGRVEGRCLIDIADISIGGDSRMHRSYPFLVQSEDHYYLLPEQSERSRVELYWFDQDRRIGRVHTLLEGMPALDPTVFEYDGHWYMIFCDARGGPLGTELEVWHSDELLGPWQRHPASPVTGREGRIRPAGRPFLHDGVVYRPVQYCVGGYGRAVIVVRIDELSSTTFRESEVSAIVTVAGPYCDGVHTLSKFGQGSVVDGNQRVLRANAMLGRIVRRIRHLGRFRG